MNLQPLLRASAVTLAAALAVAPPTVLSAQGTLAEVQTPARYAKAIEFARTLVAAVMQESGTPGMSVAVGIDGVIVWAEGFGYADVENRVPVWPDTKFRIGSVSKPLTAAALGLLVEQGKVDLDAPVQRYVPTFPRKRWPVTTRTVAGHLAGIRHYDGGEFLNAVRYATVADGLEIFQDDTLLFEPGERFSYSSYGWNLISAVIEGASGQDFLTYMQQNVFDPIAMRQTVADYTDSVIPHRTRFYERNRDGHVVNAPYVDNSYKWAGGGFLSTPSDLVRFGFAHFGGDVLQPATLHELWTPQSTNAGESTGYGIGWSVMMEGGVVVRAGHGGGSVGGTTGFETRPQERAVIALVGNMTQAPTGGLILPLITEAFLESEALVAGPAGPDMTGDFVCTIVTGSGATIEGAMKIGGSPAHYWGRISWDNGTVDRIIHSASSPDKTRFVTVDEGAVVLDLQFTAIDENGLRGTWRSGGNGAVTCRRG
ncbi:MAG: beta-lactamase family protein [Gemmatimonadota bacterium]|nr:beta-lactamase family protein [Gemmatimonadota bacterium]